MLLGAVLLGAVGCAGGSSGPTSGETPARPGVHSATLSPAGPDGFSASAAGKLDTASAEPARAGREYADVPDPALTSSRGPAIVKALADDGQAVVVTGPPPTSDRGKLRIYQSTVGKLREKTFTPFPEPVGGPARNAVYVDAAGPVTAWTETTSTNLDEFDWKVFLHDGRTDKTRLLGDSRDVSPVRPVAAVGETVPTVGEREVFWAATARRSGKQGFDDLILAAPIDRPGPVRRIVVGGYFPAADGADLFYVSSAQLDRNAAYAGRPVKRVAGSYEIRRLRDGRTTTVASGALTGGQTITGLTAHGGAVAYTVSRSTPSTSMLVLVGADAKRTEILMHHSGGTTSVRLTDRFLAWGSGSVDGDAGQYVLDRVAARLYKLGEAPGRSLVYASSNGTFLGWTVPPPSPAQRFPVQVVRWLAR